MKRFWCEIYLNKVQNNVNKIKELSNNKKVIAVVKGNAYGLGIEEVSNYLDKHVNMFAVADIDEARRVRSDKDILLLSPLVSEEDFYQDMENLVLTIDNEDILEKIPKERKFRVHLYIDTGMRRMGIKPDRLDEVVKRIKTTLPNVKIEGLYTHLHNAANEEYTLNQIKWFKNTVNKYIGEFSYIHCLNSTAMLSKNLVQAAAFTNTVRCGNIIYGYDGLSIGMERTYNYYCTPVNEYKVKKGETIGYGCLYKAKKDMHIGILGLGNIEHLGFEKDLRKGLIYDILRTIRNHFKFRPIIFNGNKGIEIIGRVNMNTTIVNLEGVESNSTLRVEITPILADSSIPKVYLTE